jgi:anaerobic selenocysteine-containing dehydrogenase
MSPDDAGPRNITQGDWVRVLTSEGHFVARASLVAGLAAGAVFGQHGWWEKGLPGTPYDAEHPLAANFNRAIDTAVDDPVSGSIALRCFRCEVERIGPAR